VWQTHFAAVAALHQITRFERIVGAASIAAALRYFSFGLWGHVPTPVYNSGEEPSLVFSPGKTVLFERLRVYKHP